MLDRVQGMVGTAVESGFEAQHRWQFAPEDQVGTVTFFRVRLYLLATPLPCYHLLFLGVQMFLSV
jgi:hypothetical protein